MSDNTRKIGVIRWYFVSFLHVSYDCSVHLGDMQGVRNVAEHQIT